MLKQSIFILSILGLSIPLKASFDFKLDAENVRARPAAAAARARMDAIASKPAHVGKAALFKAPGDVLSQAIERNDIPFIKMYVELCPGMRRKQVFQAAAQMNRGDILLALIPEGKENATQEHHLKQYFFAQKSLTPLDVKIYHHMLGLIQQKEEDSFQKITECLEQKTALKIPALAQLVAQMLHPTLRKKDEKVVAITHPELEQALITGDLDKVTILAGTGWVVKGEGQGLGALTLAVNTGNAEIVEVLLTNMPHIDNKEKLTQLCETAKKKKENFKNKVDQEEMYESYDLICKYLNDFGTSNSYNEYAQWMEDAFERQDAGSLLKALEQGANQNTIFHDDNNFPYTILGGSLNSIHSSGGAFEKLPVILQILTLDKNFNPASTIKDPDGNEQPLLWRAITKNLAEHTQILLDAGCAPNAVDADGLPMTWHALHQDNPDFLQMLINTGNFDLGTTVKDAHGRQHSLLVWAIDLEKPLHFRLLLNARCDPNIMCNYRKDTMPLISYAIWRDKQDQAQALIDAQCDPNALDSKGRSVLEYALNKEKPIYLKMLIQTGRLDLNVTFKRKNSCISPLSFAREQNKHGHAQLLVKAKEESEAAPAAGAGAGRTDALPAAAAAAVAQASPDAGIAVGGKRKAHGNDASNKKARNE